MNSKAASIIVDYVLRHVVSGHRTEMCGRFRDMEHFRRFSVVEAGRGWLVSSARVLR